ncbi:MAG: hypothetical protein K1X88_10120 [Nannocystaceae bacterium]|nr:hypothetical protein [Nannocystaceae bacterium]
MHHAARLLLFAVPFVTACPRAEADPAGDTSSSGGGGSSSDTSSDGADEGSSSSAGGDSEGGSSSSSSGDVPPQVCALQCESAVDCCVLSGSFGCEDAIGIYPNEFVCEANGTCSNHGCPDDAGCSIFDGGTTHFICVAMGSFGTCVTACETDADCEGVSPTSRCRGDDAGRGYCAEPPCTGDDACVGTGMRCLDERCQFHCVADDECGGNGRCEIETGTCVCDDAAGCGEGFACVPQA